MVLKGASFYPAPRIDSQGVLFVLRRDIDPAAYPPFFKPLVRSLFAARRKTIKNNLHSFMNSGILDNETLRIQDLSLELFEKAGINPNERAENLGIHEFLALAAALTRVMKK
jgi:16S rRNA (adenine1518-N6/adenine1519-N6)-dimethyltransferase